MGIVTTQSYRTIQFQGNRAKITFLSHAIVYHHSKVRTAH
jgi:hypothetical protein